MRRFRPVQLTLALLAAIAAAHAAASALTGSVPEFDHLNLANVATFGATPSAADPLWLALYPGAYATIVLLVRHRIQRADAGPWLDGLVAGLATTALGAAFVFRPVLDAATGGTATVATTLAYPLSDVTLLALLVAGVVLTGARPYRR